MKGFLWVRNYQQSDLTRALILQNPQCFLIGLPGLIGMDVTKPCVKGQCVTQSTFFHSLLKAQAQRKPQNKAQRPKSCGLIYL